MKSVDGLPARTLTPLILVRIRSFRESRPASVFFFGSRDALCRDDIDLVAFTSASQAVNLFTVAQYDGKEESLKQGLGRTLVASIGPVCSTALHKLARVS
jgi:uroporphyrinogen-III synthase